MITKSQASGAKVLLVGMRIPTSYGARYGDEFAAVYPKIASSNAIPLVPFLLEKVALNPDMMQADKIHPNDKGQPQLLANVMAVFEPFLKQKNTK
jgi:acyl-CoA thioesterase-1